MKKFIKFANGLIIILFCVIIVSITIGLNKKQDMVINGVLDVSNIKQGSAINLSGVWGFYWEQQVLSNGKIQNMGNEQMVTVPSNWTKYKSNNKKLPIDGYAVYRIIVKGSKGDNLALKIPQIGSSYNLWIDGKIRYSSGHVGKNAIESKPKWTTKVVNFSVQKEYTEVMIEVSNFHYFRAGITTPIIIGTESQIQQLKYGGLFIDSFIFAVLFVMAVFFLLLYLLYNHNKSYAYLALFSAAVALRPLLYGECYFNNIFQNLSFEINTKIYLVTFVVIQLFFLYFYYQYEELLSKKFVYFIGWPLILIIAVGVIIPAKYMIYPVILLEALIPIVAFICIYLLYLAYRMKYQEVGINLLSILLLSFLSIIDILNNNRIIQLNTYYTPIAMLIITSIQTFLQICKFRESALLNEKLIHEVDIKNLKLEYEIKQRNITEKLNNGLKAMVSTLQIEELLVSIIDNLHKLIEIDNAVIVLNVDKNLNFIVNKLKNGKVKCSKYKGKINFRNINLIDKETLFEQVEISKLYTKNDMEKNLIVKPLYYKGEVFCVVRIIVNRGKETIDKDIQLIDLYCEESILALQNAKSYEKIKELAMYDELTKIYNRRYLMKLGMEEFNMSKNIGSEYGVVMLDIDNFKKVNDTYGHLFGDKIIKNIADICKKCMPANSIIGRYGGEEFIIFLKNIKIDVILSLAEKLNREVENSSYSYKDNNKIKVTISGGIAMKHNNNENLHNVINNADKALYKAKESGKNCIRSFEGMPLY